MINKRLAKSVGVLFIRNGSSGRHNHILINAVVAVLHLFTFNLQHNRNSADLINRLDNQRIPAVTQTLSIH